MKLKALQNQFYQAISSDQITDDLCAKLKGDKLASIQDRMNVYSNGFKTALIDLLENDYAATFAILGDKLFNSIAEEYTDLHPATHPLLAEVSRAFPPFIATHPIAKEHPYLPNLVHFEWLLIQSFYDSFHELNPPKLQEKEIQAHPSVKLFKSAWPISKIYLQEKPLHQEPCFLIIWDNDGSTKFNDLTAAEFNIFENILKYNKLSEVIEHLGDQFSAEELSSAFQDSIPLFVSKGLLSPSDTILQTYAPNT